MTTGVYCFLVYDTYRTHSPDTHTWKEVTDISCQIELGLWVCYIGSMVCLQYRCTKPCARKNAGCRGYHMCRKKCYEECGDCMIRVERKLPNCEHSGRMSCHMDPETYQCKRRCNRILPCQHPCPNLCSEECGNCPVKVSMWHPVVLNMWTVEESIQTKWFVFLINNYFCCRLSFLLIVM